ncbi:MAG: molybdopterin molybdotransferase MoeA [Acidobacteria bacterium]|nr:molybdopterin molybdotransferase MoeA [Acidobacteriota bacterium]
MLSVEKAYQAMKSLVTQLPVLGGEMVSTYESLGRVLAQDIHALADHPSFDQSAMDGFAFQWQEGKFEFALIGTIAAGDTPNQWLPQADQCVRIMTGAPVPQSCDTVVMVEHATVAETIRMPVGTRRGQHIRKRGSNVTCGQTIFAAGTRITPAILGALATQGMTQVHVRQKLTVQVAATGSEVVALGDPLGPGQIINSNSPMIAGMLRGLASVVEGGIVADTLEGLSAYLSASKASLNVLSGGVSAGDFDFVPEAARLSGYRQIFHKVAMKPGKPIWLGVHPEGRVLVGLPGNPVSTWVATRLFVIPLIEAWTGGAWCDPPWIQLPLLAPLSNRGDRVTFLPAHVSGQGVNAIHTQGSGDLIAFAQANSLMRLEPASSADAGTMVSVLWC